EVEEAEAEARNLLLPAESTRAVVPAEEVRLDGRVDLPFADDVGPVEDHRQSRLADVAAAEPAVGLAVRRGWGLRVLSVAEADLRIRREGGEADEALERQAPGAPDLQGRLGRGRRRQEDQARRDDR